MLSFMRTNEKVALAFPRAGIGTTDPNVPPAGIEPASLCLSKEAAFANYAMGTMIGLPMGLEPISLTLRCIFQLKYGEK